MIAMNVRGSMEGAMMKRFGVLALFSLLATGCESIPQDPPPLEHHPGKTAKRKAVKPFEARDENPDQGKQGGPRVSDPLGLFANEHLKFGAPKHEPGTRDVTVVEWRAFVASHNNDDKIADWVAYKLTKAWANGTEPRPGTSAFKPDSKLAEGFRAELKDYKGSGYDRGHQCAAADARGRGKPTVAETFFLSNMTPQLGALNQQGWKRLEAKFRSFAKSRGTIWVVTGPAFIDDDGDGEIDYWTIGDNEVAVPTHYFKIAISQNSGKWDAIAFLVPHKKMTKPFKDYLTTIDEIERVTGLDFFSKMKNSVEKPLEKKKATAVWRP